LKLSKKDAERQFQVNYLSGHTTGMDLCLRTAAQVGVCALKTFKLVFPERYDLLGLSDRLRLLESGL